jgi:hypothetical protein
VQFDCVGRHTRLSMLEVPEGDARPRARVNTAAPLFERQPFAGAVEMMARECLASRERDRPGRTTRTVRSSAFEFLPDRVTVVC